MTIHLAYQRLTAQLYEIYETREAANIADMVIEHVTGQRKIERIVYKDLPVNDEQQKKLQKIGEELLNYRPVQYVLGEAWFIDMKLMVNEHVLIPRPETEELVQWVYDDLKKFAKKDVSLIDIGTGSGCIPIALKRKIPVIEVSAIDLSGDALMVAKYNSVEQKTVIDFVQFDFLKEEQWDQLGNYDVVVSNPPYIKQSEQGTMRDNVLKYEPPIALFVPDEDALIFYEAIAKFSKEHLKPEGSIYVEINETLGKQVVELFTKNGFSDIILKKDLQGKDRLVKAKG